MIDEDPLFEGTPLLRGRSTSNRINWEGISFEVRQFFRLLGKSDPCLRHNRLALSQLVNKKIAELKVIYPELYMEFKELSKKGELPKLQMSMTEAATKKNNPFGINRSY